MNNITLKHLNAFVTVYKEKGITLAAEKLGYTQPQVSLYIRELEDYYGTSLFERKGRGIEHTEAARQMFEYASHILSMCDDMDIKMKNWDTAGKLRIGSSISIGVCLMPTYIKKFKNLYPEVELSVVTDSSDIIEQMIEESRLDFALIEGNPHSEKLEVESFMEDELVLFCSPEDELAGKAAENESHNITLQDIEDKPILLRERNSATRSLAEETLVKLGMAVTPFWESSSTTAIINAVIEGLGISILPRRFLAEYIREGRLVPLKLEGADFKRSYNIIYSQNKFLTGAAVNFFEMINEM